ncbi:MAG: urease accessory protein UreG [Chloroflexota bacterium]
MVGDGGAGPEPRWGAFRVGVGGPVGSGKTALIEALVPRLVADGADVVVVTNDIVTREDERHVKATLAGVLAPERIVGVQTGTCPHAAVREDPSMNLAVLDELAGAYPDADYAFVESGGDNLTLTFSPELVDHALFVIDVAGGDKVPRKRGIGLIRADLLVINKTDLAPHVGADLGVMAREGAEVRDGRPLLFTDCRHGDGLDALLDHLRAAREAWTKRIAAGAPRVASAAPPDDVGHGHAHGPDGDHRHD